MILVFLLPSPEQNLYSLWVCKTKNQVFICSLGGSCGHFCVADIIGTLMPELSYNVVKLTSIGCLCNRKGTTSRCLIMGHCQGLLVLSSSWDFVFKTSDNRRANARRQSRRPALRRPRRTGAALRATRDGSGAFGVAPSTHPIPIRRQSNFLPRTFTSFYFFIYFLHYFSVVGSGEMTQMAPGREDPSF